MQIKNRQQLLTFLTIAVVALFAGDKLILSPLIDLWKTRAATIAELRKKVDQGRTTLERERTIRDRWEQMRRNSLPSSTSAAEQTFFKAMDAWARDSQVVVGALTPQWKREADDFMTLQCRVDASGNIASLSRFVYDIEKDPMALKLESIGLASKDKEGQLLSLNLQLSGLVFNTQKQ